MIGRVPHLDGIAQALKHKYGNEPDNHTVRILLQDVVVRCPTSADPPSAIMTDAARGRSGGPSIPPLAAIGPPIDSDSSKPSTRAGFLHVPTFPVALAATPRSSRTSTKAWSPTTTRLATQV